MTSNWRAIAKAEFLVQSSKFRRVRKPLIAILYFIALIWAFLIAPFIESSIITLMGGDVEALLTIAFPGAMRSVIFMLWMMLLVYPIIYALRDIKIGQLEIMLSHNVDTRDILIGSFIGKIPGYFLLTLFLAPILLSPFLIVYQVSIIGTLIIYLTIFLFAMVTLWLSIVISTAIQAKLGGSEKGEDIAKAFGMIFALLFLLPLYGLMYFAPQLAAIMGLDVFLLLPATWGADTITALTLFFSGLSFGNPLFDSIIAHTQTTLPISVTMFSVYFLVTIIGGLLSADRLFRIESGKRAESITSTGNENIFLRIIRRLSPTPDGVLLITALKDFGRKAQNISRLLYGMFLAVLFPFIFNAGFLSEITLQGLIVITLAMTLNMMLAMISAVTIGGTGFIESKDHLWILKSTPNGTKKFVKARALEAILLMIPVSLFPASIISILTGFSFYVSILVCINVFVTTSGGVMVGIGITASNPTYENRQSLSFKVNSFMAIIANMIGVVGALIVASYLELVYSNLAISLLVSMWITPVLGITTLFVGASLLARTE